jgi:predicted MFS family arabinose efflux permease
VSRIVDSISPPRLGTSFRWLLASSWSSNLGDGMSLAAGPLLVASETDDPLLVAAAALLQRVPWLLFGLLAGVVADRFDRRRVVVAVDLVRTVVLAVLAATVVTGTVDVTVVLVAMFLLGTAETFADVTTSTLMPMLLRPADIGIGNARLMVGHITANQLAGPPIGAALFALGRAWPFAAQAVCIGAGALLVARITVPSADPVEHRAPARRQVVEGVRWLWHHAPVRTLTITIVTFNVTFGAAWSVLVLWSAERLDLGDLGFGLLTTVSATGGVLGSWAYGWIERRVSLADLMRIGLVIETFTHLALALTTVPALAMVVFFVFGAHAAVWGTTSTSIRHRAVPRAFQGRVASVYMMGVHGGIVVGSALGGLIARVWGVTGPFWFAFAGSALILVLIWRELSNIAHVDAAAEDEPAGAPISGPVGP